METITRSAFLDEQFASSSNLFRADLEAYRNHAHRVLNFALALSPVLPNARRKLEIASYFHDLGIWADSTFDYIQPSARRAREYLEANGLSAWSLEVTRMISEHHKVRSAHHDGPLVEAFRKADWVDVSLGLLRFGLSGPFVSEVRRVFPNQGFHRRLVELTLQRIRRHPLSPLPMFKW